MFTTQREWQQMLETSMKEGATNLCGFSSNKQADNSAFVCFAGCTRQTSVLPQDLQQPPKPAFQAHSN